MTANPRIILWIALAFVLYLNYEAWTRDYAPPPVAVTASGGANGTTSSLGNSVPQAPATPAVEAPTSAPPVAQSSAAAPAAAPGAPSASEFSPAGPKGHVRTDVLDMDIALQGGTVERADLLRYPKVKGQEELVRLMNTDPATLYLLQSGLFGPGEAKRPTHLAAFTS